MKSRKMADLALKLNRDVLWLERELHRIRQATGCSADRLRMFAAEALEKAKKRRKRTMARP